MELPLGNQHGDVDSEPARTTPPLLASSLAIGGIQRFVQGLC
jgi:hypothetical protein